MPLEFIMAAMNNDKLLSKERMAQAFSAFDQVALMMMA